MGFLFLAACGSQPQAASVAGGAAQQQAPQAQATPTFVDPPRVISVSGSGDILSHPSLWSHAVTDGGAAGPSYVQEFAGVAQRIKKADYAVCHVEQTFNDPNGPVTEYPNYYTHPAIAEAIGRSGFDACSTASNWTFLKGMDGIARTNKALRRAGVEPAGSYTSAAQAERLVIEDVQGVKVAHLSFTEIGESPGMEGADWAINRADADRIVETATAAREQGAEVVIVSLAMGDMGSLSTSDEQNRMVRRIARTGQVNLIIGHGSHTIQTAQKVDDTWVVWHGNLLASFFLDQPRLHEGLVSTATLTEQPDGTFEVTKIRGNVVLSPPMTGRLEDISAATCESVPARWQEAYDATRATLSEAIDDGFVLEKPCRG